MSTHLSSWHLDYVITVSSSKILHRLLFVLSLSICQFHSTHTHTHTCGCRWNTEEAHSRALLCNYMAGQSHVILKCSSVNASLLGTEIIDAGTQSPKGVA